MKQFQKYYPTLLGALIFMIFDLYNGFPIVNGDTGTYLNSALNFDVPGDRPIFYGLFIFFTSFGLTIWTTAFIQCLILSWLSIRFIKGFRTTISTGHIIALLLIFSLGTLMGWYSGQIMPDAFTPILFLSIYIYLRQQNTAMEKMLLLTIIYIAIVVHFSHYMIALLLVLILLIISFVIKGELGLLRIKLSQLLALVILCWLSLFTSNLIGGHGFVISRSSHVFLMGKLCESGILERYLDKDCPEKQYKICACKDNMSPVAWGFVWDPNGPVSKSGGWDGSRKEYQMIIKDIVGSPEYWPLLAYKSMEATLRQIVLLNIDESEKLEWIKYDREHPVYHKVEGLFTHEINELAASRQNGKTLNIVFYDAVFAIILLLSTIICLFFMEGKVKRDVFMVYFLLILFLFLNAFVTATFANVLSRLNSRAIGLLPMVNIIFIYRMAVERLKPQIKTDPTD